MTAAPARRPRLALRIAGLSLALLLVIQAVSLVLIRRSIEANARQSLRQSLAQGEGVLRSLLARNADHLLQATHVLAADYGFRSAIASDDRDTIASALANHGERLGASVMLLTDARFQVKASAGPVSAATLQQRLLPQVRRSAVSPAAVRTEDAHIALLDGEPYQVVAVPVRAPLVVGYVLMGFPLQDSLLQEMRRLTALDVVVLTRENRDGNGNGTDTGAWRSPHATLAADDVQAVRALWGNAGRRQAAGDLRAELSAGSFLARSVVLRAGDDGAPAAAAVLLGSVDEAIAPYRPLQWAVLLLTGVGVAVFAVGSLITARRITTPLSTLGSLARRLAAGDYDAPLPAARPDEIGELAASFEAMRQAVRQREQAIRDQAYTDPLTGLPNRAQFSVELRDAVARQQPGGPDCAVLLLDLDRFKQVNDVLGHDFGDLLLQQVARRLSNLLPAGTCRLARLGGDEFAVLLQPGGTAQAIELAGRIALALEQPLMLGGQPVDLGAGMGVAACPDHASDAATLLRRAEMALYQAKQTQAGVVVFQPELDATTAESLSLLGELRQAVDGDQLRVYLQPKVALDGRIVGAEALVRWQHPERGLVPPMRFIPFAEQTGFIRALTAWLIEQCAAIGRQWQDAGLDLALALNLSTRDLIDPELPARLDDVLRRHGLPPSAFGLEITESAIMDDPQRALQTLERLHGMGLRLAIDDFGTGYSSLAYLKRLPVDELKIDKSFVMNMERDAQDAKIVRSTIDLAHNLGLKVVAEGIENETAWRLLAALQCDQAQGYWIARPMPAEAFIDWVRSWQPPAPDHLAGMATFSPSELG
ncbi:MAG: putative bifunctional diguanylate cyclase/phosphodiesterase [Pseudomonadota bacterium]